MTNKTEQALEALDELIYGMRITERQFLADEIETIRAALQPKPSVDLEELKKEVINNNLYGIQVRVSSVVGVMDETINILHSQGHLNQGWRDIESAPKDGTEVLVYCPTMLDSGVCWAYYYKYKFQENNEIESIEGFYMGKDFGWCDNPTHWMPLPQPPKNEDE